MTIRSGGRPRDERSQAHPYASDAYAAPHDPDLGDPRDRRERDLYGRGRRNGNGRGSGLGGILRFLVFALVLAAIVLVVAFTALRPIVNGAILSMAEDNPAALQLPFVADMVREDLGGALTTPASTDPAQIAFVVEAGDTAATIAERLKAQGLITDPRAFVFIAVDRKLTGELQAGEFLLRKNMTPDQLVSGLLAAPEIKSVEIALRTGLRLEQITAKLQTLPLTMDVREFYELAKHPPADLVADYPWLKEILATAPEGSSLEGFLWPSTYRVLPDTTAEELIRLMLDNFEKNVGTARMSVPEGRGLNFYQVLALASIVEREAVLDEERPLIAGVYQNRIDGIPGVKNQQLNADPTVFFANDTMELAKLDFEQWQQYSFWSPPGGALKDLAVPPELAGYQTYVSKGLIPGPIATPTLASIDAALEPDTEEKYIYFVAIPDGAGKHAFARTAAEHEENLVKYGYR